MKVPPKSSGNTAFDALPQDVSDTSAQQNKFLGSNGADYKRYDRGGLWKSTAQWLTYLRGAPTVDLLSSKIITELSSS